MGYPSRGITIDLDGSLQDVDRNADALEILGCYEATLERALAHSEAIEVSAHIRQQLSHDRLSVERIA